MKTKILDFLAKRKKAIAAVLAPIIVIVGAKVGFHIDMPGADVVVVSVITAITSGLAVHQVPNKPAPYGGPAKPVEGV